MIFQKQTFDELSIANTRVRLFLMAVGLALLTHTGLMSAEPVRVLYTEGSDESSQASAGLSKRIFLNVLKNISPEANETKVSYVVATPKARLVELSITPHGEKTFVAAGIRQKAMRFVVKVNIGGLGGLLAPRAGNKPADINVWIAGGKAPPFVRSAGVLYRCSNFEHSNVKPRMAAVASDRSVIRQHS